MRNERLRTTSRLVFTYPAAAKVNRRYQALSRIDIPVEQAAKAIVYGLLQVLLASEVAFCCQDGGVTEKKLYLLQLAAIYMAELCTGSPKVVRGEVVKLQTQCTAPDYVPDDVSDMPLPQTVP